MKPVGFSQQNCVYAKDQAEYLPLPAHKTPEGIVISCWKLTLKERIKILFTGRFFWRQWTFHQPLQPVRPSLKFND